MRITCNSHWWDKLAEKLSPKYRIIAYDLPGRGDSATPSMGHGFEEHAKDILTIIDKLQLGKVTLLCHSYGAAIAYYFASQYGDKLKRMVLVDGGCPNPAPSFRDVLKSILDGLDQVFPSFREYLEFLRNTPFYPEWSPYIERWLYYGVAHRPDGSVTSNADKNYICQELEVLALRKTSFNKLHRKISAPTLVLWAPQGFGLPGVFALTREKGEEIARLIPESRFAAIENSNHFTIMIKDQTFREIEEFLSGNFSGI